MGDDILRYIYSLELSFRLVSICLVICCLMIKVLFAGAGLQSSKYAVLSRHIPLVVMKKEGGGPYWPRLLSDTTKVGLLAHLGRFLHNVHWLKKGLFPIF